MIIRTGGLVCFVFATMFLYSRTGFLMFSQKGSEDLQKAIDCVSQSGIPHELLSAEEVCNLLHSSDSSNSEYLYNKKHKSAINFSRHH